MKLCKWMAKIIFMWTCKDLKAEVSSIIALNWSEIYSDEGLLSMLIPMSSTLLGNLHLNFTTPEHSEDVLSTIEPYVFEWTGLFSAN